MLLSSLFVFFVFAEGPSSRIGPHRCPCASARTRCSRYRARHTRPRARCSRPPSRTSRCPRTPPRCTRRYYDSWTSGPEQARSTPSRRSQVQRVRELRGVVYQGTAFSYWSFVSHWSFVYSHHFVSYRFLVSSCHISCFSIIPHLLPSHQFALF